MKTLRKLLSEGTARVKSLTIGAAIALAVMSGASAATYTWTQTAGGTYDWVDTANWSAATAPVSASDTAILIFADTTTALPSGLSVVGTNTLGSGSPAAFTLNTLTLNGKGPNAAVNTSAQYVLQGADLVFAGTNPALNFNAVSSTYTPLAGYMPWYNPVRHTIASNVQLSATTTFGGPTAASTAPHLVPFQVSGVVSGVGGLTKAGSSAIWLSNTNTYQGDTTISAGTLRADDGVGLPTASKLVLNYGTGASENVPGNGSLAAVLQTSGRFTRAVGTGAGQVQWNAARFGGFAATDSKLTVSLGSTGEGDPGPELVWNDSNVTGGTAGFIANTTSSGNYGGLVLSSSSSTSETEFTNAIDLHCSSATGSKKRQFYVEDNPFSGSDLGTISGTIRDGLGANSQLYKVGTGTLRLTGTNTYAGTTEIKAGILDAVDGVGLPSASYLKFWGGVFQSHGTLTRTLSNTAGANKLYFNDNGGLSARGGKLTVTLNGGATITWADTAAGFNGKQLWLNGTAYNGGSLAYSSSADSEIEITNNLDMGAASRSIFVVDNPFSSTDVATLSGNLTGTVAAGSQALVKQGNGVLRLTGTNTFTGVVEIGSAIGGAFGGALEAIDGVGLPSAAYLRLSGGVFQSKGTFTRSVSATLADAGKVGWRGAKSGGFAASDADLVVRLNNDATTPLSWHDATNGFVSFNTNLFFGSVTSAAKCDFQNAIEINATNTNTRSIFVEDNPTTSADYTVFSGVISDTAAVPLVKLGPGKLVLSANNTYRGTTQVAGGILAINGTPTGTGAFSVNPNVAPLYGEAPGATLSGTGTIPANVTLTGLDATNFAAINAGDELGTLAVTGNVTFGDFSRMLVDISGSASDKLAVTGAIALSSSTATDSLYINGVLGGASSYHIATAGSISGKFDAVYYNGLLVTNPETTAFGGYKLAYTAGAIDLVKAAIPGDANGDGAVDFADYLILESTFGGAPVLPENADFDGSGTVDFADYLILEASFGSGAAVPEPMTLSLLALGGLALLRRK